MWAQQSQGSWYQAGISQLFGMGCAEKEVPAVYADAYAACWIDSGGVKLFL